ncbi:DUF92 domain-containing protein [Nocardia sp. NPDC051321]|uniref:DUF92 domain-containing protein n=1 Tax=Nocardia sp. NPDC051321 TaxID=3364323 RepID=UPI00379BF668
MNSIGHDLLIAVGAMVAVAVLLAGFGRASAKMRTARDVPRKIAHGLCGVVIAVATYQLTSLAVAIAVLASTAVVLVVAVERHLIPDILDGSRIRDYGYVGFALGLVVAAALFWPDRHAIACGALTLGLADSGAALVGSRFGRHRVTAGGVQRSLEGSVTFATIAAPIAFAFMLLGYHASLPVALAVAVFVGVTTASIELLVPPAADNLLITPWVALLLDLGRNLDSGTALRWLIAAVIAYAATPVLVRLRWLDLPGAIAAALVTAAAIGLGGWTWLAPVAAFFVLSSIITALHRDEHGASMRGLPQVMVNGVAPVLLPVVGYALTKSPVWFFVYVGGIAASNADTWASEIGRFSPRPPVSLRTRTRVPPGTSGAVSTLGFAATSLGGAAIGVVGALVENPALIVVGLAAGIAGSLADSVLGATVQGRFRCPSCHRPVEDRRHCGVQTAQATGIRWVDNEVVNALANATGMVVALSLFVLVSA